MFQGLDWKDLGERAIWTFLQAALGALPAGLTLTDGDALKSAAIVAVTAGIAAVLSLVKNVAKQRLEA